MTRDEVIATIKNSYGFNGSNPHWLCDSLVALGLVKLDEPKTCDERFQDFLKLRGRYAMAEEINDLLSDAGLMLVEKQP